MVVHYHFGLSESSLDHRRREEFPAISIYTGDINEGAEYNFKCGFFYPIFKF